MSESYKIIYSPQALDDLKGIYSYIAFSLKAASTAKKLVNRIRKEIRTLYTMPERYAAFKLETWQHAGTRKLAIGNFVVIYTVDNFSRTVSIIRILYGGMDIDSILLESSE